MHANHVVFFDSSKVDPKIVTKHQIANYLFDESEVCTGNIELRPSHKDPKVFYYTDSLL